MEEVQNKTEQQTTHHIIVTQVREKSNKLERLVLY